jgi:ribokinase
MTPERVTTALAALHPRAGDVILVGHEIPTAAARAALAAGREAGATTILNPAPATGLDRSTFGLADVLTPNRGELAILLGAEERRIGRGSHGEPPEIAASRLLQSNSEGGGVRQAVIVTLGAAGAVLVRSAGEPVDLAGPPVTAVDSVGAGDALNGALAAGLARGLDLESATRRAVAAAALSTTREGAREGLPTADQLAAAVSFALRGAASDLGGG